MLHEPATLVCTGTGIPLNGVIHVYCITGRVSWRSMRLYVSCHCPYIISYWNLKIIIFYLKSEYTLHTGHHPYLQYLNWTMLIKGFQLIVFLLMHLSIQCTEYSDCTVDISASKLAQKVQILRAVYGRFAD